MWGRAGRGVIGTMVVALMATVVVATPGGAQSRDTYYIIDTYGHPFEPYAELPNEVQQGVPGTNVELQAAPLPVHCEAIAALYEPSVLVDGVITIVSENRYHNPSKAWAHNPPDNLPSKAEVSTFPNGPRAYAECPTDRQGVAKGTFGGYVSQGFSLEGTSSDTTNVKVPDQDLIVTETTNKLWGLKAGDLSIASIYSWLKVEFKPAQEPLVSYRLEFTGVSDGKQLSGMGKDGFVLSGQKLGGDDWIKQFNAGSKEHEGTFEAIARYGFRILEPKFTRNQRSAADRGGSVYPYYYELSALDGKLEPSARKDQTGHGFGMRVGVSRVGGSYEYFEG